MPLRSSLPSSQRDPHIDAIDRCPLPASQDGKRLLFHFIEEFLTVKMYGLQSGFGVCPDSLLFVGPHGSTLSVPVDILLEPREIALQFVQEKIRKSAEAFSKRMK